MKSYLQAMKNVFASFRIYNLGYFRRYFTGRHIGDCFPTYTMQQKAPVLHVRLLPGRLAVRHLDVPQGLAVSHQHLAAWGERTWTQCIMTHCTP